MIGANIAPGAGRDFNAQNWANLLPKKAWYNVVDEANDLVRRDVEMRIQGYDLDAEAIRAAMVNARDAGVDEMIHFQQRPVSQLRHPKKYGFIITNPPYGERLEDKKALPALYTEMGEAFRRLDDWSWYILTSYFYQFMGPKPPKAKRQEERR